MATLSTDDKARRLEFVWLGPVGSPWPFEARGKTWGVGALVIPAVLIVLWVVIPSLFFDPLPGSPAFAKTAVVLALGIIIGLYGTKRGMKQVTPTRPLNHHMTLTVSELDTPRKPETTTYITDPAALVWIEHDPALTTGYVMFESPSLTRDMESQK